MQTYFLKVTGQINQQFTNYAADFSHKFKMFQTTKDPS